MLTSNSFPNANFVASNLISEKYSAFGDFDQCISLTQIGSHKNGHNSNYNGKYCLVHIEASKNAKDDFQKNIFENTNYSSKLTENWTKISRRKSLANGICVPSICSEKDIEKLIRICKLFCNLLSKK